MRTKEECLKLLSKLSWETGVSPNLISNRLLSKDDKQDMLNGNLSFDVLKLHVTVWRDNGMPNYSAGKFDLYRPKH